MFDDLPPVKKTTQDFPRNLEDLSVQDLEKYLEDLTLECERVKGEIIRKKAHLTQADSFFKK